MTIFGWCSWILKWIYTLQNLSTFKYQMSTFQISWIGFSLSSIWTLHLPHSLHFLISFQYLERKFHDYFYKQLSATRINSKSRKDSACWFWLVLECFWACGLLETQKILIKCYISHQSQSFFFFSFFFLRWLKYIPVIS